MNGIPFEENEKQKNCPHLSWRKATDGFETFWMCNDCEASCDVPAPNRERPGAHSALNSGSGLAESDAAK